MQQTLTQHEKLENKEKSFIGLANVVNDYKIVPSLKKLVRRRRHQFFRPICFCVSDFALRNVYALLYLDNSAAN